MIYNIKYLEPNGEKEIEAKLEVADTNMSDLPLLLSEFADKICGASGLKVTSINTVDEDGLEEGLDRLQEMVSDKLGKDMFAGLNHRG